MGEQAGRGNLDNQIVLGEMMHITVLEAMPSIALHYFERAKELGIDIKKTNLWLIISMTEGLAESGKKKAQDEYGPVFRDYYAASTFGEIASECGYGGGMHITSNRIILETINPKTKQVLGPGEEGKLVGTNLIRKAIPRLRIRIEDVAKILPYEPCSCGRTHPKLSKIRGRMSQLFYVEGKTFFPIDVEEIVYSIPGLGYEYQIIREKPEMERLRVRAEYRPDVKDLRALANRAEEALYRELGVKSEVELVPKGSIARALFKAQRVVAA